MPARSNSTQRLVARIYEAVEGSGATVRESQFKAERGVSGEQEIDILIVRSVNGRTHSVAIEVRGHRRKQTRPWINELVGRFIDIEVDQVIAVALHGFSKSALEKAHKHGILTLSLTDAEEFDWPAQFTRLGMARLVGKCFLIGVRVLSSPQVTEPVDGDVQVNTDSSATKTWIEIQLEAFQHAQEKAREKFAEVYQGLTLADIKDKAFQMDIPITPPRQMYFDVPGRAPAAIQKITVRLLLKFDVDIRPCRHQLLSELLHSSGAEVALATTAAVSLTDPRIITVVQEPSKPDHARVTFDVPLQSDK